MLTTHLLSHPILVTGCSEQLVQLLSSFRDGRIKGNSSCQDNEFVSTLLVLLLVVHLAPVLCRSFLHWFTRFGWDGWSHLCKSRRHSIRKGPFTIIFIFITCFTFSRIIYTSWHASTCNDIEAIGTITDGRDGRTRFNDRRGFWTNANDDAHAIDYCITVDNAKVYERFKWLYDANVHVDA